MAEIPLHGGALTITQLNAIFTTKSDRSHVVL